ncbi:MAG: HU family DNA-binding protein [Desulfobacterales bacterium]|nr:HU family DNA-binding protein [Desulfobacterales bacterium]
MTKSDLVDILARKTDITKTSAVEAIDVFTQAIADALKKGDKVTLIGFGTFDVAHRAAREGVNPQTRQKIKIKASKAPRFKAGKALKDAVN